MVDYLPKFKLNNKNIIINGGLGLLGMEISLACLSADAKVIILDIDKSKKDFFEKKAKKFKDQFNIINFDTSNYKTKFISGS